jgi:hypothetical protein
MSGRKAKIITPCMLTRMLSYLRRTSRMPMRPNSIVNWFVALFAELGFECCFWHLGRRTFITGAVRRGRSIVPAAVCGTSRCSQAIARSRRRRPALTAIRRRKGGLWH